MSDTDCLSDIKHIKGTDLAYATVTDSPSIGPTPDTPDVSSLLHDSELLHKLGTTLDRLADKVELLDDLARRVEYLEAETGIKCNSSLFPELDELPSEFRDHAEAIVAMLMGIINDKKGFNLDRIRISFCKVMVEMFQLGRGHSLLAKVS